MTIRVEKTDISSQEILQRANLPKVPLRARDGISYKIHSDDVARIEKAAGKRAENLTEPELLSAMKNLGIRKLEITPEENEEIKRSKTE